MRVCLLLFFVARVFGEVIDIRRCPGESVDTCTINEIRLSPCKNKDKCHLKKGSNATISFDFVPHFSVSTPENSVKYQGMSWSAIQKDACNYVTCPIEAEKAQTYTATMHIGKKLPNGKFEFNWKIYDANNVENQCCFLATVLLK